MLLSKQKTGPTKRHDRPDKKPARIAEDALRVLIKPFIGYFSYKVKQKIEIYRK